MLHARIRNRDKEENITATSNASDVFVYAMKARVAASTGTEIDIAILCQMNSE